MSGRKVPEYESDGIREVIEKPYRIIYRIKPDQIDVLAVVHGDSDINDITSHYDYLLQHMEIVKKIVH